MQPHAVQKGCSLNQIRRRKRQAESNHQLGRKKFDSHKLAHKESIDASLEARNRSVPRLDSLELRPNFIAGDLGIVGSLDTKPVAIRQSEKPA